jgi:hypothetical protein
LQNQTEKFSANATVIQSRVEAEQRAGDDIGLPALSDQHIMRRV